MTLVLKGIRAALTEISKIEKASFQRETYEQFCGLLFQASLCLLHQTNEFVYEYVYEYVQLVRQMAEPKLFWMLYNAQLQCVGKTLSKPELLCPKTIQVVDEMVQFKLTKEGLIYRHFLSFLVYGFRAMENYLQFDELEAVIIQCC